jgi:hypothetical protein
MTQTPEKVSRAAQVLAENVDKLKSSESYKAALEFRAKFHSYSFANCFLIYQQYPTATLIAGYMKWKELGRQVKKGEHLLPSLPRSSVRRKTKTAKKRNERLIFAP